MGPHPALSPNRERVQTTAFLNSLSRIRERVGVRVEGRVRELPHSLVRV